MNINYILSNGNTTWENHHANFISYNYFCLTYNLPTTDGAYKYLGVSSTNRTDGLPSFIGLPSSNSTKVSDSTAGLSDQYWVRDDENMIYSILHGSDTDDIGRAGIFSFHCGPVSGIEYNGADTGFRSMLIT